MLQEKKKKKSTTQPLKQPDLRKKKSVGEPEADRLSHEQVAFLENKTAYQKQVEEQVTAVP